MNQADRNRMLNGYSCCCFFPLAFFFLYQYDFLFVLFFIWLSKCLRLFFFCLFPVMPIEGHEHWRVCRLLQNIVQSIRRQLRKCNDCWLFHEPRGRQYYLWLWNTGLSFLFCFCFFFNKFLTNLEKGKH